VEGILIMLSTVQGYILSRKMATDLSRLRNRWTCIEGVFSRNSKEVLFDINGKLKKKPVS